jgi:hypothetical protein
MALPLWFGVKLTLKVGATIASKYASKSLAVVLGKTVSSGLALRLAGYMARSGMEGMATKLFGANSIFLNSGPFDQSSWTYKEKIRATIDIELAEARGPGERYRFALLRKFSPFLSYKLQRMKQKEAEDEQTQQSHNLDQQHQQQQQTRNGVSSETNRPEGFLSVFDEQLLKLERKRRLEQSKLARLKEKIWSVFFPIPTFPFLRKAYPTEVAYLYDIYTIAVRKLNVESSRTFQDSFKEFRAHKRLRNFLRALAVAPVNYYSRVRWKQLVENIDTLENYEFVELLEKLGEMEGLFENYEKI